MTWKWKNALLLLGGIGISNIGGWVYLIALNLIVLQETGSPLAVALLYMLGPAAAVCANFWSGSVIDRVNSRKLMIGLDLSRAFFIALIPVLPSLFYVYLAAFLINLGSAIFQPASMVYMTRLILKKDRQKFNALRSFMTSSGTLIGPAIAGILFWAGSLSTAIYINAVALILSAAILLFLPDAAPLISREIEKMSWKMIKNDFNVVYKFSQTNTFVLNVYLFFVGSTIFMTAIDSLEASFASTVLEMTDTRYGFFLSIFGIGIILGSLINTIFSKQLAVRVLIGYGSIFTAVGYIALYSAQGFLSASAGTFIIGLALPFASTGYLTFYQNNVPENMMGRFGSLFSIVESALIILLTISIGTAAEFISIRSVGIISSIGFLFLGFGAYKLIMRTAGKPSIQEKSA